MSQVNQNGGANVTITKIQRKENSHRIEVRAVIAKEGSSALALLNQGDDRFDNTSSRYGWMMVRPEVFVKYFPGSVDLMTLENMKVGDEITLNIENPMIAGLPLNIEVTENHIPDGDYELQNWEKVAKQIKISPNILKSTRMKKSSGIYDALDQQGFFVKNDQLIYSHTRVVTATVPKHTFIEDAMLVTKDEAINLVSRGVQVVPPAATSTEEKAASINKEVVKEEI